VDPLPRGHLRGHGLGCSHFARRYFGNHSLFSLPQGTEMFHFPWLAPSSLCIQLEVTPLFAVLGFPIRTSPDQRSVDSSPELFAATHVLHRLLAPRHPPHALSSLLALISFIPASRRIIETRKSRPRPLLFAAGPEDFYVDSIQRLIETVLRRRYVKASRLRRTWQVSLLRELLTQQKLNLPFVCTCQRTQRPSR
jgi:hypothetical protein